MKETMWTPGPWRVGTHHQILSDGGDNRSAGIASFNSWMGRATAEANANLIAAAPELYEALKLAVENCPCSVKERDSGHRIDCYAPAAIEALAKARGEVSDAK